MHSAATTPGPGMRVTAGPSRLVFEVGSRTDATKTQILDAAESLFAEQGFASVTIRDIATTASVNIAAVNYHFGSKENLFEALFARRVVPVNQERLALLAAAEKRAKGGKPRLREVIDAFVRPPMRLGDPTHGERGLAMMRFLSRMLAMPKEHVFLEAYYGEVRGRFIGALAGISSRLPYETVLWRYNMMVGALIYALAGPQRMLRPPAAAPRSAHPAWDAEDAIVEIVDFCVAGFGASSGVKCR